MTEMIINIDVDPKFAGCINSRWLKKLVGRALELQGCDTRSEVSLMITGQHRIHELNRIFLEEDRPTDVLSFPMLEASKMNDFILPPDGITHLGEVIVSYPQAVLQADDHGHTVETEMSILVVHGLLHLLGFDHAGARDAKKMKTRETYILKELGGSGA